MKRVLINRVAIVSFVLTFALTSTLACASEVPLDREKREVLKAREKPVADNPGARQRWKDEWYNENYGQTGPQAKKKLAAKGLWTPEYMRFLMQAANKERLRYSNKMPRSGSSEAVIDSTWPSTARGPGDSPNADLTWLNIGPTKADFITNGVTLNGVIDSGRVRDIVTVPGTPNTIYVAFSGGGLWKSTDGGAFWQAKTETLGSLSIGALEMDPVNSDLLYLGLGDPFDGTGIGVVKSTNGGDTWSAPVFLGDSRSIRDVLVTPGNRNVILVATNAGLYRSTDAGVSYSQVSINTGVAEVPEVWSIVSGGGNNVVLSLEAAPSQDNSQGQVWRSTDGGATWSRANGITHPVGIKRVSLASAASNRNVMYAMAEKPATSNLDLANIFRSSDGGINWTAVATNASGVYDQYTNGFTDGPDTISYRSLEAILGGQGSYNHLISVDPNDPNIAYFGGAVVTVVKTTDGGGSFTQMANWLSLNRLPYVHADSHAAHIASNGTLYVGSDGGIFRSTNGGTTFSSSLNEGIASHLIYNVCSSPANTDRVFIGLQDNGSRLRVGNTSVFNQVLGGDGFGCNVNRVNANNIIGSIQFLNLRRSTNGGSSFGDGCNGITECEDPSAAPFNTVVVEWAGDATGNTLYTFSNTRVYRTTNYAANWAALAGSGLPSNDPPTSIFVIRGLGVAKTNGASTNSDTVLGLVANGGRVFLSTNRGATWTQSGALPNNGLSLSSIAFDPNNRNIVYVTSVAPDATKTHVWRSTDFGATWAAIDGNGFPTGIPVNSIAVDPVRPASLYASTHLGVYRSLDSGNNWERFGSGMPLVNVTEVAVSADGNQARAATFGRSAWELRVAASNAIPVASFTSSVSGLTASFTDSSTDSDGSIVSRSWNFGDGTTSTATNPAKTYAVAGTYSVSLTVTDNGSASNTVTKTVTVTAPAGGRQTYSNTTAIAIPDNNNTGVTRTVTVSGRTGNAPTNASVAVNITHSYRGDLIVDLIAPDGTVYNLHNRAGGAADNIITTYTRDLSSEVLNGTWSLRVRDVAARDIGTLNNWSITF